MLRSSNDCCARISSKRVDPRKEVEISAPATLQEGYVFWATVDNVSFPVRVPAGGVRSGQLLRVELVDSCLVQQKGQWKDGLFSCFRFGFWHPHMCNAWLCPQVLLGQILTRMQMTWLVAPTSNKSSLQSTFRKILFFLIAYALYDSFVAPPMVEFDFDENGDFVVRPSATNSWYQLTYVLLSLPMSLFGLMVVVKLRATIRAKYGIPTGRLGKAEDLCCVCCCNCCVISQLARQTADYDDDPASYCSPNGMMMQTDAEEEAIVAVPV